MDDHIAAKIFKALGDDNRLRIIKMLTNGEYCACELLEEFNITQPTLSHHMKVLSDSALINSRKDGKWTYYSLNCETMTAFRNYVGLIVCHHDSPRSCHCK